MTPLQPSRADGPVTPHPRVGNHQEAGTRYIGRGNNGDGNITNTPADERGGLGNPYKLDDHTRAESVFKFGFAFADRYTTQPTLRDVVDNLTDQQLGCFCRHSHEDSPACHGDVLATWVDHLADPEGTALAVAGSRHIHDRFGDMLGSDAPDLVAAVLDDGPFADQTDNIETVIHGGNTNSPDGWGQAYAEAHPTASNHAIHAPWDHFGNAAGPLRNGAVITDLATYNNRLLVAFWDGNSPGTKDTINRARNIGIDVQVVNLTDKATREAYMTLDMINL